MTTSAVAARPIDQSTGNPHVGRADLDVRCGRTQDDRKPVAMDPTKRHLAALAFVVCVLAGCGGGGDSGNTTSAGKGVTVTQWAGGLRQWGHGMQRAIDGISVLFSRPADVRKIQAGEPSVGRVLRRYERTLAACSDRVRRLGTPPASLMLAHREALHACVSLERASVLIGKGVAAFQRGLGPDVVNTTAQPLSDGEDGVRRAQLDVVPSP
jgi:hypothetical protein